MLTSEMVGGSYKFSDLLKKKKKTKKRKAKEKKETLLNLVETLLN